MKIKLYFKNSQGEQFIAECDTVQEAHKEIRKFLDKHSYKSYYTRSWSNGDGVTIDVGSHTEFFILKGISHNDYIAALECGEEPEEQYHQITMDERLKGLGGSDH